MALFQVAGHRAGTIPNEDKRRNPGILLHLSPFTYIRLSNLPAAISQHTFVLIINKSNK